MFDGTVESPEFVFPVIPAAAGMTPLRLFKALSCLTDSSKAVAVVFRVGRLMDIR